MPYYISGKLIKEIRERKGWQQNYLQSLTNAPPNILVTLSRVENLHQQPTYETVSSFMKLLEMPIELFFCPFLENQSPEVLQLRDQLLFYLDAADEDSEALRLSTDLLLRLQGELDMVSIINRQFVLSCRARLSELNNGSEDTLALVKEGIHLTYPEFDEKTFAGELLIFEEPELLHTLAMFYARNGRVDDAINLLDCIVTGVMKLPQSEAAKEKSLPKILNTLAGFLIMCKDYDRALEICESGIDLSIKRDEAIYVPRFAFYKAQCLFNRGKEDECAGFVKRAYASYGLLGLGHKMEQIRKDAQNLFGIIIETHDAETLLLEPPVSFLKPKTSSIDGYQPDNNVGNLIRQFRLQAKIKPKDVYLGICSKGMYSLIERGKIQQADILILIALFQRLGRDPDLYFNAFLSKDEFEDQRQRYEIQVKLSVRNCDEVEDMLKTLLERKSSETDLGLQRYKYLEAIFLNLKEAGSNYLQSGYEAKTKMMERRLEALKITRPDYDEEKIGTYRLTEMEFNLIHSLALYYCHAGDLPRGIEIFKRLRESILNTYMDIDSQGNRIPILLHNLSYYTSELGKYEEALAISNEGEGVCVRYGLFYLLPNYAVTKGICLFKLGRKEESLPYFAMAYHGACLTGHKAIQELTSKYAIENFGITF